MKKNKTIIVLMMALAVIFLNGCNDNDDYYDDDDYESAFIRFVHVAASVGELYIQYKEPDDDFERRLISGLSYGEKYGYYEFETREVEFLAYYENSNIVISRQTIDLRNDVSYTIFLNDINLIINPEMMVAVDSSYNSDSEQVLYRFINLSADVNNINIVNTGTNDTIVRNLSKNGISSYIEDAYEEYQFVVIDTSNQETILEIGPITFSRGISYTIVLSGSASGILDTELNAMILQDISYE